MRVIYETNKLIVTVLTNEHVDAANVPWDGKGEAPPLPIRVHVEGTIAGDALDRILPMFGAIGREAMGKPEQSPADSQARSKDAIYWDLIDEAISDQMTLSEVLLRIQRLWGEEFLHQQAMGNEDDDIVNPLRAHD